MNYIGALDRNRAAAVKQPSVMYTREVARWRCPLWSRLWVLSSSGLLRSNTVLQLNVMSSDHGSGLDKHQFDWCTDHLVGTPMHCSSIASSAPFTAKTHDTASANGTCTGQRRCATYAANEGRQVQHVYARRTARATSGASETCRYRSVDMPDELA
jgi:hypothetical protein